MSEHLPNNHETIKQITNPSQIEVVIDGENISEKIAMALEAMSSQGSEYSQEKVQFNPESESFNGELILLSLLVTVALISTLVISDQNPSEKIRQWFDNLSPETKSVLIALALLGASVIGGAILLLMLATPERIQGGADIWVK